MGRKTNPSAIVARDSRTALVTRTSLSRKGPSSKPAGSSVRPCSGLHRNGTWPRARGPSLLTPAPDSAHAHNIPSVPQIRRADGRGTALRLTLLHFRMVPQRGSPSRMDKFARYC
jgi:hypothetical protein